MLTQLDYHLMQECQLTPHHISRMETHCNIKGEDMSKNKQTNLVLA